jgi:hypothetical protein
MPAVHFTLAHVLHTKAMNSRHARAPLSILMKESGVSFFTMRVLQRWSRGEIGTDTAVELIQTDEAARIIGTWTDNVRVKRT